MATRTLAALFIVGFTALAGPIHVASAATLSRHRNNCEMTASGLEGNRCTQRRSRFGEQIFTPSANDVPAIPERTGPKVDE